MKRNILIILIVLLAVFTTSCSQTKAFLVDSKVWYDINVPKDVDGYEASIYFSRISDVHYDIEDGTYIVGEEVILQGENVEQFAGSTLYISQIPLQELIDYPEFTYYIESNDSYTYHDDENFSAISERTQDEVIEKDKEIRNILKPYTQNGYALRFSLTLFTETFSGDVNIEKLVFDDIEYEFDKFTIAAVDLPTSYLPDVYDRIYFNSFRGYVVYNEFNSLIKHYHDFTATEGVAEVDIDILTPLFEKITEENYQKYEDLYGMPLYDNSPSAVAESESSVIVESFTMIADEIPNFLVCDGFTVDMYTTFTMEDSSEYTMYETICFFRRPELLLNSLYHAATDEQ